MSGEVLVEFALAFDVIASEVLLVSIVHCESAQAMEGESTAEVKSNRVLLAVVE